MKNNKQRLFEVLGKIDDTFKINEDIKIDNNLTLNDNKLHFSNAN